MTVTVQHKHGARAEFVIRIGSDICVKLAGKLAIWDVANVVDFVAPPHPLTVQEVALEAALKTLAEIEQGRPAGSEASTLASDGNWKQYARELQRYARRTLNAISGMADDALATMIGRAKGNVQ